MDAAPTLLAGGGVVGLFALSITLVVWLLRIFMQQQKSSSSREEVLLKQIADARAESDGFRNEHRKCEMRLNAIVAAMTKAGIAVPDQARGE